MPIAKSLELLDDLLRRARKAGADAADAVFVQGASLSIAERLGKPEKLERAEGRDLGLRVFVGKRQAIVSSTDFSRQGAGRAGGARRRHGQGGAGRSLLRHCRSGGSREDDARTRPLRSGRADAPRP